MRDCCRHKPTDRQCKRKTDGKVFRLRKFSKERCMTQQVYNESIMCSIHPMRSMYM